MLRLARRSGGFLEGRGDDLAGLVLDQLHAVLHIGLDRLGDVLGAPPIRLGVFLREVALDAIGFLHGLGGGELLEGGEGGVKVVPPVPDPVEERPDATPEPNAPAEPTVPGTNPAPGAGESRGEER